MSEAVPRLGVDTSMPDGQPADRYTRFAEPESVRKLGRKLTAKGNVSGCGAASAKRVYIGDGVLIGWKRIAQYLGVHVQTAMRWRRLHGFPVGALPDGRAAISTPMVDGWLMARFEAQQTQIAGERLSVGATVKAG